MRQRGRKSTARLSVVPINAAAQRPAAPDHLTADQATVWQEVVESTPAGWFSADDLLLAAYCRHVVCSNVLAKVIDAQSFELDQIQRLNRLLAMRERETRMLTHLATKMRLTQQARMHPRSAGRAMESADRGRRPWERD